MFLGCNPGGSRPASQKQKHVPVFCVRTQSLNRIFWAGEWSWRLLIVGTHRGSIEFGPRPPCESSRASFSRGSKGNPSSRGEGRESTWRNGERATRTKERGLKWDETVGQVDERGKSIYSGFWRRAKRHGKPTRKLALVGRKENEREERRRWKNGPRTVEWEQGRGGRSSREGKGKHRETKRVTERRGWAEGWEWAYGRVLRSVEWKRDQGEKETTEEKKGVYAVTALVVVVENSVTESGRKRKSVLVFPETDRSEREETRGRRKTDEGSERAGIPRLGRSKLRETARGWKSGGDRGERQHEPVNRRIGREREAHGLPNGRKRAGCWGR